MAVHYRVLWQPDIDLERTLQFFVEALGLTRTGPANAANEILYVGAINLSARAQQIAAEEEEFPATMSLTLEIETDLDDPEYMRLTRQAVATLVRFVVIHDLECIIRDMNEDVILKRAAGITTLNADWKPWHSWHIDALLPQPFRVRAFSTGETEQS
jgi:hypothetical protein